MTGGSIPVPDFIAFDTETTGLSAETDQIIEVALVRFRNGKPTERWSSLVKPDKDVGLKTLRLTGISLAELQKSQPIESICSAIEKFRAGLPLVGHNSGFDISFLSKSIPHFPGVPVYDTLELARIVLPGFKTYKLSDLARELGIPLKDAHRACDDAEASGVLFRLIQERLTAMPDDLRKQVVQIMGEQWPARNLFEWVQPKELGQLLLLEEMSNSPLKEASLTEDSGYSSERRWVERVMNSEQKFAAVDTYIDEEAVDRIIKSALQASESDYPIVIAGDFEAFEHDFLDTAYLFAPDNYLCMLKADMVKSLSNSGALDLLDVEERRFLSSVIVWANSTETGLFNEIQLAGKGYLLKGEISCDCYPACLKYCPFQAKCFYSDALRNAKGAKVILTSKTDCEDLPVSARMCVILGLKTFMRACERRQPRLDTALVAETLKDLGSGNCIEEIGQLREKSLDVLERRSDVELPQPLEELLTRLKESLSLIVVKSRQIAKEQMLSQHEYPLDSPVISLALHRLEYFLGQLHDVLHKAPGQVSLLERGYSAGRYDNPVFSKKYLWPALNQMRVLLGRYDKVALASEELSFADGHKGLRLLCGLDHENVLKIMQEDKGRFGRADEGVLLVQVDGQKPAWRGRVDPVSDFLQEFVTLTGGNLLCLCPSYRVIRDLSSTITQPLEEKGIAVFSQGIDGGPTIAGHLSEPNTVVLSRFGVEIPALATGGSKVLVIPKIPFAPPNTVDDLRRKELSALGEDGFVQVNVLPAVFWIRSYIAIQNQIHKRSSVVLLDPKILPGVRGWGQSFSDAMIDIDKIVCLPHDAISRIGAWVKTE